MHVVDMVGRAVIRGGLLAPGFPDGCYCCMTALRSNMLLSKSVRCQALTMLHASVRIMHAIA